MPDEDSLLSTLIEWERSVTHTTCGCDGCQEGCESGYYDLHRYLDDAFLHPLPPFLALRSGLLADPVVERSYLLDVLLLGGILLLRSDVDLLLHAISAQRTHILEGSRSDVIIADTLRTEADVHALHVGIRVPLTLQQGQIVPKPVEDSPLHQDQWLDNQDLSQLLHVSVRSLQRYRSLGILPYKMMHKKTYYTKEGWNGKPYKTK